MPELCLVANSVIFFRKALQAEYHTILAQSYKRFPYVSDFFLGPYNGIWALVNPADPDAMCNESQDVKMKARLVKITKNNAIDKLFL